MKPLGTLNNCGSGITPWGTYLTCEENFINYFNGPDQPSPHDTRLGLRRAHPRATAGTSTTRRFDAVKKSERAEPLRLGRRDRSVQPEQYAGQAHRAGPRGARRRHRGSDETNRAVVYSGEDARFEVHLQVVSRDAIKPGGASANAELLDHGTLYVARFDADGRGRWIALTHGQGPLTAANGFADQGRGADHDAPGE